MRLFVINPNSTPAMTEGIRRSAERAAAPGTTLEVANPVGTPASIEGRHDEAAAVPAMLAAIRAAEARGAEGHVIACFDDPGLGAAREVAAGPVVGICEAGVRVAGMIAARFSVVTTLGRSVPVIEDLVEAYGAGRICRRVRAVELPVLALEADPGEAEWRLAAEIAEARDRDGAEAVVLGCAGMAGMADRLAAGAGIPVIDGVRAGVKLAEALVGGGFRTSKAGSYAFPREK
jgi:allantoin racemase